MEDEQDTTTLARDGAVGVRRAISSLIIGVRGPNERGCIEQNQDPTWKSSRKYYCTRSFTEGRRPYANPLYHIDI